MEWVETTAKTIAEAKSAALDQLGVAADEAEFDVLNEPRAGLFGRMRGMARVRARVRPEPVRPKQDQRRSRKTTGPQDGDIKITGARIPDRGVDSKRTVADLSSPAEDHLSTTDDPGSHVEGDQLRRNPNQNHQRKKESSMSDDNTDTDTQSVSPQEVGDSAVVFMNGLVDAFGLAGHVELSVEGIELDVRVEGDGLGLLVGRGGRTLTAVQDLARVTSQRRLGDHKTRLRIDVSRYRERRAEALVRFASDVAAQVRDSGTARSLEPMSSADRKVIHDALTAEDGVESRSEGDDPNRRVVVLPA